MKRKHEFTVADWAERMESHRLAQSRQEAAVVMESERLRADVLTKLAALQSTRAYRRVNAKRKMHFREQLLNNKLTRYT